MYLFSHIPRYTIGDGPQKGALRVRHAAPWHQTKTRWRPGLRRCTPRGCAAPALPALASSSTRWPTIILGGTFKADRADSHTALPHSIGYKEAAAPQERNRAASVALGGKPGDSPSALMLELQRSLDVPTSLREIALPEDFGEDELPCLVGKNHGGRAVSPGGV